VLFMSLVLALFHTERAPNLVRPSVAASSAIGARRVRHFVSRSPVAPPRPPVPPCVRSLP
jgi:hypothetical protein